MKIIAVSNFNNEAVEDILICENVNEAYAKDICDMIQAKFGGNTAYRYFKLVPDDHVLWRGMAELLGDPDN